ncbi:hypothetical protein PVL29_002440 [Vitis rotundifolia]|uniref:Uncharacterized protein n=1 Tax=Vitis rotundifolia TaxID=103349 RepID=A0AA39AHP8_VITRO|nr:hypothetical protein PVL29_002440 [Vitis rotundifolia]
MLSSSKIEPLKTWIRLRSQSLSMKNRLNWLQSLLTLWDIMNTWKLCKKNMLIQLTKMMTTSKLPTETQLRRSTREHQPSRRYTSDEYLLLSDGGEPKNYQEVLLHDEKKEWLKAMHEEMKSLHKNNT